ncbi:MAG: hypothetical protein COT26_02635 [Candidatus Kerfeldbacteria bacterium CG08_land_8_20_14_0_20_43_14]|uniref:Peptidase S8/S53 domain-containing protein n=1 Tax=Candidatus Kerfeldbacteria bacterium CG08_land_8_20_14_0_20_43_14 TaxID=2014246 RepID=A0A2H0YPZ6_9BACT|nr:MAG: hypothetical protein COT26_02635 [Candidatus Kerfeldbacteria bacterium CG08_land_8_20_14_0_20_43_14]
MKSKKIHLAVFFTLVGFWFFSLPAQAGSKVFEVVVQKNNGKISLEKIPAGSISAAIKIAKQKPGVKSAEQNVKYHAAILPNDPDISQQWALPIIGAPTAWETRTDASNVVVAVLDSGVDITNPDLVDNIWSNKNEIPDNGIDDDNNGYVDDVRGWNFIENSNDPRPKITAGATQAGLNHGTVISGIIGARGNNGLAGSGVAWSASIMAVRVLDSTGSGNTITVAKGIQYAVAAGAKIINLSFVGSGSSPTLAATIESARVAGVVVVAAAGNDNLDLDSDPQYPVCYPGVLGVASVDQDKIKSSFSNYGSCVDISAPGENIYSTLFYEPTQGYDQISGDGWYGTSVASPFVAGAAALLSATTAGLSVEEIENLLELKALDLNPTNPGLSGDLGTGQLFIESLLSQIKDAQARSANILAAPQAGDSPRVREFSKAGKVVNQFMTGTQKNQKGIFAVSGDVNQDGQMEIITSFQANSDSTIRVYDQKGKQLAHFLAFSKNFKGGATLAVGDVDGNGQDEIIVGTDKGTSQIRIFDSTGKVLSQFFAFAKSYSGGVRLAVGDVDADGQNEIIVSKASKEPRVAVFSFYGKQKSSIRVFPLKVKEGVNVASADINGDGKAEIIIGLAKGSPQVRIFSGQGKLLSEFLAYDKSQTGGVNVASADINADGIADIITGTGVGAKPEVRVFRNSSAVRILKFLAYPQKSRTGVHVGSIQIQ